MTNIDDDEDGDEKGEGGDGDGEEDQHVQGPASLRSLAEAKRQKITIQDDLICIKFLFQILTPRIRDSCCSCYVTEKSTANTLSNG